MASSSAAQSLSTCPQFCSRPSVLKSSRRLDGRAGTEVSHGPPQGVCRLVEFRGIPLVDRLPDLRHPLRAFVLEKPRELLQQFHISIHALKGRSQIEG